MTTEILGITELADGQVNQYAVANAAFDAIEKSTNDLLVVNLASANVVLTSAQFAAARIFIASGNAVARDLTVPAKKREFVVQNGGSAMLSVMRGSTVINIAAGDKCLFTTDGTTNNLTQLFTSANASNFLGGTLSVALNEAPIVTLASSGTVNIGAAAANTISISGTTTITAFDSVASGALRRMLFQGILTLTHNATSLILPTAADIVTASGDTAEFVSLGAGNWRCVDFQRAAGTPLAGSGGGLTGFASSLNTSSPNATVNASQLVASGGTTNQDAAIQPKGSGALLAQLPDSTAFGGDKRGTNAVDLQTSRSNAANVASGNNSTISGGNNNKANATRSTVGGGTGNVASGSESVVCGGNSNVASNTSSVVAGGILNQATGAQSIVAGGGSGSIGNVASGTNSSILGGDGNAASGDFSSISGGEKATTRGLYGMEARANGLFFAAGDAQRGRYILRRATTNATPAALTANAGAASSTNIPALPNTATYAFRAMIAARSSADQGAYLITGLITRGANAASTAMVGTPVVTVIAESAGAAAWDAAVTADTTNGGLLVNVTGAAATNIKWVCDLETVEVVG